LVANLRKRQLIEITVIVLLIATIAAFVYISLGQRPANRYEKSISRNFENSEQETALLTAETADYSEIFNITRFPEYGDNSVYRAPNFIDEKVVEYYDKQFGSNERAIGNTFNYTANVYTSDKIQTFFENKTNKIGVVHISNSNGSILSTYSVYGLYAYNNGTGIERIKGSLIDFEFVNCYLVSLNLEYSETYGNISAFISLSRQTIIMDSRYNILFIGFFNSLGVA
jgi:hypothetical protein